MIPIISSRPDGLGTRLLSILHGLRFAEQTGASFSIGWPSLDDCNYPSDRRLLQADSAGEIFNLDHPIQGRNDVQVVDRSYWLGRRCCMLHGALQHLEYTTLASIEAFCKNFDVFIYDLPVPLPIAGSSAEREAYFIKQNWKRFSFCTAVGDTFAQFASESQLSSSVAIHIRRGDVLKMLSEAPVDTLIQTGGTQIFQRYTAINSSINALGPLLPHTASVVVCSEDHSVAEQIAESIPGKHVYSSRGLFPQDSNRAALLDLMILSGARWLITPFKSYFSECASIVGECDTINVGLDVRSLVDDLISIIDKATLPDRDARQAVVYALGFLNLWHLPNSEYRWELHRRARAADSSVADALIGNQ